MSIQRLLLLLAVLSISFPLHAQHNNPSDTLLDHLAGEWLLTGSLAGGQVEHDISAGWVLGREYFQIKETSRERDPNGHPAYEAIVYITFNKGDDRYDCLWLDNTSNAGLSNGIIAHAGREPGRLALVFKFNETFYFHTTFSYNPDEDSWSWLMRSEDGGKEEVFADAVMKRVQ